MSIVLKCPGCRKRLLFPPGAAGQPGECPHCSRQFTIRRRLPWTAILVALVALPLLGAMALPRWWSKTPEQTASPGSGSAPRDEFAAAVIVSVTGNARSTTQTGKLETADSIDMYRVPGESLTSLTVRLRRAKNSRVAARLVAYDAQHHQLQSAELESDAPSVELPTVWVSGKDCFVRVESIAGATGGYELLLTGSNDVGDTPETAYTLELEPDGDTTIPGEITPRGDTDLFRFTAPSSGTLTISQRAAAGSELDSRLAVYNDQMELLAENDDWASSHDAQVTLPVAQGQTYLARAGAVEFEYSGIGNGRVGGYTLTIVSLPGESTPPAPIVADAPVELDVFPYAAVYHGSIQTRGEQDRFSIFAPVTGRMTVVISPASTVRLDGHVVIENELEVPLTTAEQSDSGREVSAPVESGMRYFLRASASSRASPDAVTGDYVLRVTFSGSTTSDDIPDSVASAHELQLRADGTAEYDSQIETGGDADLFRFTAVADVEIQVTLSARNSSLIDCMLSILDASSELIAQNDDGPGLGRNSQVTFTARRGQTYFARAAAYSGFPPASRGDYRIAVAPVAPLPGAPPTSTDDDVPNMFAQARELTFDDAGKCAFIGRIAPAADIDLFRFVAPRSGTATILMEARPTGAFDSYFTVFNSREEEIGSDDDSAVADFDAQLSLNIVQGETYYVRTSSYNGFLLTSRTGEYRLSIDLGATPTAPDDHGNTVLAASRITLDANGGATASGRLEAPGDVDCFWFEVATPGPYTILADPVNGGTLRPRITLHGPDGAEVPMNDPTVGRRQLSDVDFTAVEGSTYFLRLDAAPTAGPGENRGGYRITIRSRTLNRPN